MNIALVVLVVYFLGMVGIGLWTARLPQNTDEEYLLGGRGIGPAVTALKLQSTSMSGYMFLGAGSLGHTQGYFGLWYALGDLGGGILNLSVLGRRMRILSQKLGSISAIEYLGDRYESKWVRLIAAPIALGALFLYVLSQFIAGGSGLASVTGWSYQTALLVAVGVIVAYTFLGGYLAVAYTDFVQAIIMLIGMVWILFATIQAVGGLTAGNEAIKQINPNLLTMWGAEQQFHGQWGLILGALFVFSIGYLGWPHVVVSHMAMKNPSVSRKAGVYSLLFNILFIPAPYLIGVMSMLLVPSIADPEKAIFSVAEAVLPPFAVGIVMSAVMAAIMSTADALLLQVSTIAARDFLRIDARLMVIVFAAGGIALALWQPPAVFTLVIFATTILGSAFAPAYVCAVWWSRANKVGAIASMMTGTVVSVGWKVSGLSDLTLADPMVAGLVASTLAMIIGSLATQKSHPVSSQMEAAVRSLG